MSKHAYNERFKQDDPYVCAPKTTKWRLNKKKRDKLCTSEQGVSEESCSEMEIDRPETSEVYRTTGTVSDDTERDSRCGYNQRFKEEDPFKAAPKTTKWRLKKKGQGFRGIYTGTQENGGSEIDDNGFILEYNADDTYNAIRVHPSTITKDEQVIKRTSCDDSDDDQEQWYDCLEDEMSMWFECDLENQNEDDAGYNTEDYFFKDIYNDEDDSVKPIYDGAAISLAESALLILTFALKHNLTGECLSDLLSLISIHCLTANLIHSSLYKFRAYFSTLKSPLKFHRYCAICEFSLGPEKPDICPHCECSFKDDMNISFFVEIPLSHQIQQLFKRRTFHLDIQHRFTRTKYNVGNIEDIFDGDLYKSFSLTEGFLNNPNNLSFMWYTDGVPLFKSSKVSLWPLFLTINELPYQDRVKPDNMLFAGLWFGKAKPSMTTFLKPLSESVHELKEKGTVVDCGHCNESCIVKGMLLCGTCDLPAKCLVMNMTQFNGKYGCPRCKQEGMVVKTGKGHTRVFPFQEFIDGPKRTHEEFIKHGDEAFYTGTPVFGVKGPSWWVNISADIIQGTAIDYMHTVLLGVVRQLLKLWFDSKFSSQSFSIAHLVFVADKRLACIKPPYYIKRHPRSIREHSHYWKASECRSWLFFYSVPVLYGLLKQELFEHYLLFVDAVFIMNLDSISKEDLDHCEELIIKFCGLFTSLYGLNHMSANLHQLLHLHDVVRQLGPLWVYSCFSFESMNGKLLKLFHGTQSPVIQIANAVSTLIKLPTLVQNINQDSPIWHIYCKLSNSNTRYKITETVTEGVHIIGGKHLQNIKPQYYNAIAQRLKTAPAKTFIFYRMLIRGVLYHCSFYKIVARNSFTVQFKMEDETAFGQIAFYTKCYTLCVCKSGSCRCSADYLAVIKRISVDKVCEFNKDDSSLVKPKLCNTISGVLTNEYVAVPVTDIQDLCTFIDFHSQRKQVFLTMRPNKIESD